MSADSNTMELSEWTWVTTDGKVQDEDVDVDFGDNEIDTETMHESQSFEYAMDSSEVGNDSSSDIEKIEEATSTITPDNSDLDLLHLDLTISGDANMSMVTKQEDQPLDEIRCYQKPFNDRFQMNTNVLIAIILALALGLGIGNFLGWPNSHLLQHHSSLKNVNELKMLQNELTMCLLHQTSSSVSCDQKVHYWKNQFEKLIDRNDDKLIEFGKTVNCHDQDEEREKLKLSLFYKQLEHGETLKQLELVQDDERRHRMKLKSLQKENENLNLQMENFDNERFEEPELISEELGSLRQQINQLHSENEDLRQLFAQLQPSTKHQNELNDLQLENGELKLEIGKIRYGRDGEKINDLREKIEEMRIAIDEEKNQTNMWKKLYYDTKAEFNITKTAWQLLDTMQQTSDQVIRAIENNGMRIERVVRDFINKSDQSEPWTKQMWNKINTSTHFFSSQFQEKWAGLLKLVSERDKDKKSIVDTVNKVIFQTGQKVSHAVRSINFTATQQRMEKMVNGIVDKFWGIMNDLDSQWHESREKSRKNKDTAKGWMFKRAQSRKEKQEEKRKSDWMFERARDREKQRTKSRHVKQENWYLKKILSDKKRSKFRKKMCWGKDDDCNIDDDQLPVWANNLGENCCDSQIRASEQ